MQRHFSAYQNERASGYAAAVKLEDVETDVPIDNVNQSTLIEHNVVALRG